MDVALAVEDAKLVVVVADVSVEESIDDRLVTPDSLATAWHQRFRVWPEFGFGHTSKLTCSWLIWAVALAKTLNSWVYCGFGNVYVVNDFWSLVLGLFGQLLGQKHSAPGSIVHRQWLCCLWFLINFLSIDCQSKKESLLNNWHFQMKLAFNAFALAYFLGILPSETSPKKKGQGGRNAEDKKN